MFRIVSIAFVFAPVFHSGRFMIPVDQVWVSLKSHRHRIRSYPSFQR